MAFEALSAFEIQKLDQIAIQKIGIPSIVLMENAGRLVTQEVLRRLKKISQKRVSIVCGVGNNGGDGMVCARHLINHNIQPKIFLIGNPDHLKNDTAINYRILRNLKIPIHVIQSGASPKIIEIDSKKSKMSVLQNANLRHSEAERPKNLIGDLSDEILPLHCVQGQNDARGLFRNNPQIIVDAIFGVGLNRDIEGLFKAVIEKINSSKAHVISVDVPSGLDATTGKIHGVCVKANTTVTFSFAKKGFYLREGPRQVGKIIVVDIGIP